MRLWMFDITAVLNLLLLLATVGLSVGIWEPARIDKGSYEIDLRDNLTITVYTEADLILPWRSTGPGITLADFSVLGFRYFSIKYFLAIPASRTSYAMTKETNLTFPHWFLALIFAIGPAIWLFKWNKCRKLGPNACLVCAYDLTGNETGVCPECGAPIQSGEICK